MSISVTCACGRHFQTAEANAGRRARCPDCGCEFSLPKPASGLDPEFAPIPWKPSLTVTSGKAIASLLLGALGIVFACFSGVPAVLLGRRALSDIRQSGGRLSGRWIAIAGILLGVAGCLFTVQIFWPVTYCDWKAARRAQCTNNLKQIGIAFQDYEAAKGSLPPAAILDKGGRPLLSWRVAILPYMEMGPLHAKFHLDEPWDSPHNLALLEAMPGVFACPSDSDRKPGMTNYEAVIGPDTAFTPDFKPLRSRFQDFPDGLDRTLFIGESRRCVPWTKPEDLPLDRSVPLTGLGSHHGYHNDGFNVLFGDGSVRFVKSSITPETLGAILSRNGAYRDEPGSY
jgi:prepilin-type processing-associated H-X9-DG protein